MQKRFLVCIGVVWALAASPAAWVAAAPSGGDAPTVGGQPAFATSSDVRISTIRSLIEAKDYAKAEELASEITTENPDVVDGWMMLAYTRSLNGKYELSNEAYDAALDHGAQPREVYTRKAYNCRRLGDPESTRDCYNAIIEAEPDNVDVLLQYGSFEMSLEEYPAAIQRFEQVLHIEPANMAAIEGMAASEKKLGDSAQVKYWLEQGLSHDEGNAKFLKQLSLIYLNEQNYSLAIHYLDRLLEIDPKNAAAYRNKGIAYYQQGEKKKAIEAFEQVRSNNGSMDGLYGPLADCYRSVRRFSDALDVIREGIDRGTQEAWLYSVWGKILEDKQNYDGAISKFSMAVKLKDEPWSGYARKQIARQAQLKKRAKMIAAQGGMK
jgi:tetratricopeptide (TPR) repeat protein